MVDETGTLNLTQNNIQIGVESSPKRRKLSMILEQQRIFQENMFQQQLDFQKSLMTLLKE